MLWIQVFPTALVILGVRQNEKIMQFSMKSLLILVLGLTFGLFGYLFTEVLRPTNPRFDQYNGILNLVLFAVASACVIIAYAAVLPRGPQSHAAERRCRWIWIVVAFIVPLFVGLNSTVQTNYRSPRSRGIASSKPPNRVRLWQHYQRYTVGYVANDRTIVRKTIGRAISHGFLVVIIGTGTLFFCSQIRWFLRRVDGKPSNALKISKPPSPVDAVPLSSSPPPEVNRRYGGIGRLTFFIVGAGFGIVHAALITWDILETGGVRVEEIGILYIAGPWLVIQVILACYRMKNIGYSKWWGLAAILPLANCVLGLQCLIYPKGYAHHKTLDRASKVIIGIFVASVFLLPFLAFLSGIAASVYAP